MIPTATRALDPAALARTAREAAEAATRVHLRELGRIRPGDARDKGHHDFVTAVDLEAQAEALAVIRGDFPHHRILAEEEEGAPGEGAGDAPLRPGAPTPVDAPSDTPLWIVDPLDGTTNFLHGHPACCASVGVVVAGVPVAGAVVAGLARERYVGWAGGGAWMTREAEDTHPVPVEVSPLRDLRQALVGTGFPFKRPGELPGYLEAFGRMLHQCSGIRRDGAAALDLCRLARGTFDAFWEGTLAPWDVAGGLAIVAAAGGCWSAPDGAPYDLVRGGPLRAANSPDMLEALHRALGDQARDEGPRERR